MHIADGVLSPVMIGVTYAAAIGSVAYGAKGIEEDDIPKIALMAGTFFAASLISIPIPPSSAHALLCGLIGIILGRRSALAFMPALFLQALLFKHGGLTSLGANTILLFIPAMISYWLYRGLGKLPPFVKGTIIGALSVCMTVTILIIILFLTDPRFAAGDFSPINMLVLSHLPLVLVEGILTGAAAQFLEKAKPDWIYSNKLSKES